MSSTRLSNIAKVKTALLARIKNDKEITYDDAVTLAMTMVQVSKGTAKEYIEVINFDAKISFKDPYAIDPKEAAKQLLERTKEVI